MKPNTSNNDEHKPSQDELSQVPKDIEEYYIKQGYAKALEDVEDIVNKAKQKNPTEILAISMLVYNQLIDELIIKEIAKLEKK